MEMGRLQSKMNLGNLTEDENVQEENNEDIEHENPEDLVDIMRKTERNFKTGNESINNYDLTPAEILDEYKEFD